MSDNNHNPIYGDAFSVLIQHFRDHDLKFSHGPETRRATVNMTVESGVLLKCRFRFDHTGEVLEVGIQHPIYVQEKFRPVVSEFLTRANNRLVVGGYQFDFEDGEIIYHASQILHEGRLEDETIARLFRTCLTTCDRYMGGLMRVMYAGYSAQDAVDLCELFRFEDDDVEDPEACGISTPSHHSKKPSAKQTRRTRRKGRTKKQTQQENTPDASGDHHPRGDRESDGEGEDRKAA